MIPSTARRAPAFWLASLGLLAVLVVPTFGQSTGGRVLGRVADPTGAVLAEAAVRLTNQATGVARDTKTNASGDYSFLEVVPGVYTVEFELAGFKKNVSKNVIVEVNGVVTLNSVLQVGQAKEVVEVTSEAPLVDTTSTQLGAVVNDRSVSQLPLNARDTYQFLQLQPGVMSTVGSSNSIVYGSNNSGAVSVNGGRGRSNNFSVNGGDANDQFVNLPTVQPSPDSIEEFRVLTNTFDAEYGRNSGSIVNVVTKSGTNSFHGNVYEFFRNKVLNANGYCFSADGCPKPQFNQNQFGGTFGGPIKKDRTFFFASYEGRRIRQGVPSPAVTVPLAQERPSATQAFSDFSSESPFSGTLNNAFALNQRPTCTTALGAAPNIPDGALYSDLFPGNIIPLGCMDATAVDLLQFVPTPTNGNTVQTIPVQPERGDQFTVKFDHRINDKQNLSVYYYFDDHHEVLPFAQFQAAGANVPGFASAVSERFQQWNISHTWTISNNTINEFRFNYNREAQRTFQHPQRTSLVQDSCPAAPTWLTTALGTVPCFSDGTAANNFGIHPGLGPQHEGLPFIQLSGGFVIGNNGEGELPQVGNSFQWSDSVSKVIGNHSVKFGGDVRRQRFDQTLFFDVSGEYFFDGTSSNTVGTDTVFPDYLLGFPGSFGEGSAQVENVRSTGLYLFAQDSWKIRPNLTFNYGLRWELNTNYYDRGNRLQTFRPGQATTQYPCWMSTASSEATGLSTGDCGPGSGNDSIFPYGLVFPGDKGVPRGLTDTYYKAFAPRIGLAWSPSWSTGWLGKLTGGPGKSSVRAGYGIFYNPIEQLVLSQFSAEPPFGGSTLLANTLFNLPFEAQSGGAPFPNVFSGIIDQTPKTPCASDVLGGPAGCVDWAQFRPILLAGEFQPHMRTQYSEQYNLTIERQLTKDMLLRVAYVGTQAHHLLAIHDL
ncbi:MAG TPA: carboxypeptidase regulatory-like domain-containing protein, partial [Terriglobales bacterium]|nr:carboxypeptidase regulatory-like domain-containing protein [Terriglobales bacterium]